MLTAKIEATWHDGSARTFRDEDGGLWRIGADAGDGTLALEEICDGPSEPEDEDTVGMMPCGIATWTADGIEIYRASSHGENHTDGSEYAGANGEEYRATPNGWREVE